MAETGAPGRDIYRPYGGYHQTWVGQSDPTLTRVGPGTPCGEYLRRYWHPVAMSSELGDLPLPLKVLGEELVLFRDLSGRLGLVQRRCPHRRASLEYGRLEERGIRCCYHGWLFAVDGSILEVPGQPPGVEEALQKSRCLGAYPVMDYKGLVFAYLGPPDEKPAFPIYDSFEFPDQVMVPYKAPFACNWLQVLDAILDPIHTAFLHSRNSRVQFSTGLGEIGEHRFVERGMHFLGSATRRVGDNVWVRINELVLPNFTQAGAAFATDGTAPRYYGRSAFSRWVVPLDDENCIAFAWANYGERGDPPEWNTPEGPALIEQGEPFERSYEERQRFPADLEATEGMGAITEHQKENLVPSDKGIVLYRKRLRALCRDLERGVAPGQINERFADPVPTYGGDTVLRVPAREGRERCRHPTRRGQGGAAGPVRRRRPARGGPRPARDRAPAGPGGRGSPSMTPDGNVKVHIKNNHAGPHTFPSTPESEPVFTITREKYEAAAARYPEVAARLEVFIDWDLENWAASMAEAEVLVTWDLPTAGLAAAAPKLRWIHVIGAGVEHLCPLDWLPEGVTVINNKGAHAAKAGEFALMAVLMLHNKMPAILSNQRDSQWESLFSTPIAGKTVLIVGVGSLGGGAADRLAGLGLRVWGVSRHGRPHPRVDRMVPVAELDDLLPEADYLFIATPATPETRGLFDRRRLSLLKPGAGLINVGRASVLDSDALAELLRAGRLSGAILDVFDPEPLPPDSPLWSVPNLVITPHVSADDGDHYVPITLEIFFANMARYLKGEPLQNRVRPDLGY